MGRLQRRDLQLPRAAGRARGARPPLPHPQRHRGHRPRLRGSGATTAFRRFNGQWAVALWDADDAHAGAGARSVRRAAALRLRARRPPLLRQRGQGDLRRRSGDCRARSIRSASTRSSRSGRTVRAADRVRRASSELEPGARPRLRATARVADACGVRRRRIPATPATSFTGSLDDAVDAVRDGARARDQPAHAARRRAGRQLSVRRARQLARRGARPARQGRAVHDLLAALRGRRVRRDRASSGRWPSASAATTTRSWCRARDIARVFPDVIASHRAADPADRAGAALPAVEAGARRRHQGRADRRRRRRDVRRLRPVPRGQGAPLLGPRSRSRRGGRGCSSGSTPYLARSPVSQRAMARQFFGQRPRARSASPASATTRAGARRAALQAAVLARAARRARRGATCATTLLGRPAARRSARWTPLAQDQYLEVRTLLSGYLLSSQGDRMLMAHSVEGRFPFLDRNVAALAESLPPAYKLRVLDEKHVLKRAARDLVPARDPGAARSSRIARPMRCRSPARGAPSGSTRSPARAVARGRRLRARTPARSCSAKCRARAAAGQFSNADNMAVVGMLSTQLVYDQFIRRQPEAGPRVPMRTQVDLLAGEGEALVPEPRVVRQPTLATAGWPAACRR